MPGKPITLSTQGLNVNRSVKPYDKFTFIVDGEYYTCEHALANFISPKVAAMTILDTTVSSLQLNIQDPDKQFMQIMDLMYGQQIQVDDSNYLFLLSAAMELQNKELLTLATSFDSTPLNPDNAARRLKEKLFLKISASKEADYMAERFPMYDFGYLKQLDTEVLEAILDSPNLQITSETQLLNFVFEATEFNKKHIKLINCVFCEYLPSIDMPKYIKLAEEAGLSGRIWESIKNRLLKEVSVPNVEDAKRFIKFDKQKPSKSIPYTKNAFGGIVKALATETGDHPHSRGDIEISASSTDFGTMANIFENNGTIFGTVNDKDSWIQFDFKNRRIALSAYSIRGLGGVKFHTMRSWKLLGSNNKKEWNEIDAEWDIEALNGKYHAVTFQVRPQSDPFRYLKIVQGGPNWAGSQYYNLALSQIDFFGDIFE
ncbi:hypothetical protein TVAG_375620 [Trichomonas vaginalis G3]|uniref:F5/8 type C domain containing protein n=1 Tax=Trichomonas vaginalis (strain ATCC PRA-98 / G3) TaxID=412133 RepID=A2FY38_TRIV3|nr:protein ubiquitination [Trichomonas vaginalis G3]EAX90171.1 hypothetical protein TVAG_375620 [Trichomonas vaginalis G3]KAI5505492.1 protein ubiquitination [Trichomonas vaginalis G3]|eukprot:XP_001303101.1 hypothetical protein [Trichomonas vaginalis G3]